MGQTLSEPVVEKISDEGADDCVVYGLSAMQGWRISMEDAHAAILDLQNETEGQQHQPAGPAKRLAFFGVYDGHGGEKVAHFAGESIHKIVAKQEAFAKGDMEKALKDGFLATDRAILSGMKTYIGYFQITANQLQIRGTRTRYPAARLRWVSSRRRRYGLYVRKSPQFSYITNRTQGNAGDSRSVLGVKGRAKPLSFDHKPQNEGRRADQSFTARS
jgi:protein phosphatase 2C family protein 2/3